MILRVIGGVILLLIALDSSASAFDPSSCKFTEHDLAVLATLQPPKHPITRDQQGKMVWNGKVMSDAQVQDACVTRRMYDFMAGREKQGKSMTVKEIADYYYVPAFLTEDERKRLSDHVARVLYH